MIERLRDPQRISREACDWYALHRERPLSPSENADFLAWLQDAPEHVREYLAVAGMSLQLQRAVQSEAHDLDALLAPPHAAHNVLSWPGPSPRPHRPRAHRQPRRRLPALAAAACMAAACLVAGIWLSIPDTIQHATGTGEVATITLADGSRVTLDARSRIEARMGLLRREIRLAEGQFSIDVAAGRAPLQVLAGELRIQDIGTEFAVALRAGDTRVVVSEGRVRIWPRHGGASSPIADLAASQAVSVAHRSLQVHALASEADDLMAWRHGRIVFRDEPLAEVIAELERHGDTGIVLEDDGTRALRISGSLDADDHAAFTGFLQTHAQLRAEQRAGRLHVRLLPPSDGTAPKTATSHQ